MIEILKRILVRAVTGLWHLFISILGILGKSS